MFERTPGPGTPCRGGTCPRRPSAVSLAAAAACALVALLPAMLAGCGGGPPAGPGDDPPVEEAFRILVFSRTLGYRHASISDGQALLKELGAEEGFAVDLTEDPAAFTAENLERYATIVFLSTSGDVLDDAQQEAFQGYVRGGGGFVGIHSASDTEYDWPWFGELLGAWFIGHPPIQEAAITVEDRTHASTRHLPERWVRVDEWYNFGRNPRGSVNVLLTIDETTFEGGHMGDDHPLAWYHAYDGGRSWYTAGGHTAESWAEPLFARHVLGGVLWTAGVED